MTWVSGILGLLCMVRLLPCFFDICMRPCMVTKHLWPPLLGKAADSFIHKKRRFAETAGIFFVKGYHTMNSSYKHITFSGTASACMRPVDAAFTWPSENSILTRDAAVHRRLQRDMIGHACMRLQFSYETCMHQLLLCIFSLRDVSGIGLMRLSACIS